MTYRGAELKLRIGRHPQSSHVQQVPCTTWAQRPQAAEKKSWANIMGGNISQQMTGGRIRAERNKSSATGRSSSPAVGVAGLHTPTSLAEASALQAVACLVCSGHQGLGKAAVGKDGAIRWTAQTGPMAGEITVILRGWTPPIHHGPCETPQVSANVCVWVC